MTLTVADIINEAVRAVHATIAEHTLAIEQHVDAIAHHQRAIWDARDRLAALKRTALPAGIEYDHETGSWSGRCTAHTSYGRRCRNVRYGTVQPRLTCRMHRNQATTRVPMYGLLSGPYSEPAA